MSALQQQATDLAADLQGALAKLIVMMRRAESPGGARHDLTLAQVSILLTLLANGPMRMTELAARERVRTPTTTVAIRRLDKLGLVRRSSDPRDQRAVLVEVTEEGLVQYQEALESRRLHLAELLGRLTDEERADLVRAVRPLERLAGFED
jgi:DNA-binding MarR family transcriptional regulator